ncbi:hypothetical protein WA026_002760 [Henosepilachna vigintioctopunctata]|uniref:Retropepsins domain-containing protein n=1 Tax=Henosepilachna vigintioctopunctata TaxID=420089 RepID=A0AAW1U151_9CUCU
MEEPQTFFEAFRNNTNHSNHMGYVILNYGECKLKFLLDTGSSVNIIFSECLGNEVINTRNKSILKGICGSTESLGNTSLELSKPGSEKFIVHFEIINSFDYNISGILGSKFFYKYGAIINYEDKTLELKYINIDLDIQSNGQHTEDIILPPRCEIIKFVSSE